MLPGFDTIPDAIRREAIWQFFDDATGTQVCKRVKGPKAGPCCAIGWVAQAMFLPDGWRFGSLDPVPGFGPYTYDFTISAPGKREARELFAANGGSRAEAAFGVFISRFDSMEMTRLECETWFGLDHGTEQE